jgi:hypothetical protein
MLRALQTAKPLCVALGVDLQVDPSLCDGETLLCITTMKFLGTTLTCMNYVIAAQWVVTLLQRMAMEERTHQALTRYRAHLP